MSVLSKCWVRLWMYVACLDFEASKVLKNMIRIGNTIKHDDFCERERHNYVDWVKKVLQLHKSLSLDGFRLLLIWTYLLETRLTNGFGMHLQGECKRLELNLSEDGKLPAGVLKACTFACGPCGLSSAKSQPDCCVIHPCSLIEFKSLRMLSLKSVIVTGGSFGVLPEQCPFLERLVVHPSLDLVHFEVCGPSLALQHVEICYCFKLKSITVCNTNLISRKVAGAHRLVLQNCPMLVEVWVSGL